MDKIIKVHFEEWQGVAYIDEGLAAWNYGQILQVEGLMLPDGDVEVHFSLIDREGDANVYIGAVKNNVITVDIPNFIFQKENVFQPTYDAYAFIYQTDEKSGRTIKKITFTIQVRPKPTTDIPDDQKDLFLEEVRQVLTETKEVADSVRTDADNGKFNGPQGLPGKDGKDGEDGQDGQDGKSAYQYAQEGGFEGTEEEFTELIAQAGQVDLSGYVTKEEHEAEVLKTVIKTTTEPSSFHHITDSANMKVVDFGMEGITEQYTGTITDESGNEITVPNPDYQQEIVNAGVYNEETGRYEIGCKLFEWNWLDTSQLYDFSKYELIKHNGISYNTFKLHLLPNTKYSTHSIRGENKFTLIIRVEDTGTVTNLTNGNNGFTTGDSGVVRLLLNAGSYPLKNETIDKLLAYYQNLHIVVANSGYAFDDKETITKTITLTSPVPITKWDKLVKRDGVWGWSVNSIIKTFDGSETITKYAQGASGRTVYKFKLQDVANTWSSKGYHHCSHFRETFGQEIYTQAYKTDYLFSAMFDGEICFASLTPNGIFESADTFKEFLKNEGVTVVCKATKEQSFIPLPDEEQTLLYNLETYYGVTNVYNEQGCPITLTYVNDTKLYVDQKLLEIQQAII